MRDAVGQQAVGDEAPIACRVLGMEAENGHFGAAVEGLDQPADRFSGNQRAVGKHDQDIAVMGGNGGARREHGIGCAALLGLIE